MFNEVLIILNCYFLFIFSEFMPDASVRYLMGWFNIGLLAAMVMLNTLFIFSRKLVTGINSIRLQKIRWDNQRKAKKKMKASIKKYFEGSLKKMQSEKLTHQRSESGMQLLDP